MIIHMFAQPWTKGRPHVRRILTLTLCINIVTMLMLSFSPDINPESLPPLPEITSDELRKMVFTHRSYHARPTAIFEDLPDDPSPDNEA
jgi:hypothetical protein